MSKEAIGLAATSGVLVRYPASPVGSARSLFAVATALLLASVSGSALLLDVRVVSEASTGHGGLAYAVLVLGVLGLIVGWRAWTVWARESSATAMAAARWNWLHAVMSETNRVILRRPEPDALFAAVCRVCVESAQVDLAVISRSGEESCRASAATESRAGDSPATPPGQDQEHLEMERLLLQLAQQSPGVFVVCDMAQDMRFRPWHAQCIAEGVRAVAVIPLSQGGVTVGMLTLRSKTRAYFDSSMVPLLSELGADISFGLDNADREHERTAALVRTQSSEQASRTKSEFLARMSHELRTPLNAVLGFAQLLSKDTAPALQPQQDKWVQLILKAGWHLLALVNDVMDLTGIEAGRLHVESTDFDARLVIEEAVAFNQALAQSQQVELLDASALSDRQLGVSADAHRLRQVLVNLVSNACKYNRPGGSVHVRALLEAESVVIEVSDDGPGMTAEQMAHLFEPFNRLGKENQGVEGTGIGLALSRQLVEMMNGRLEVQSDSRGTLARVALKAAALARPHQDEPLLAAMKQPEESSVVLYIEDEPVNQLIVEQMLLKCGPVELLEADTGKEGLKIAAEQHPDLVLLDMNLPDMSGFEVLAELNANPETESLPVVAVSASAMPQDILKAKNLGALDYWTKPLEIDSFVRGVKEHLGTDA